MPTLTNVLVNAAGSPVIGGRVTIELAGSWSAGGDRESPPGAIWVGTTDGNGRWQVDLPAQSAYEGATYYVVRELEVARYTVTVADTPTTQRLRDRLITPVSPAEIGGVSLDSLSDVTTAGALAGQFLGFDGSIWGPTSTGGGRGVVLSSIARGALSGHRMVTDNGDGTVSYASNTNSMHVHAPLWMTLGAAADGAPVEVVAFGPVDESTWSWTVGPLYLGAAGVVTQLLPTAPDALFLAEIGFAVRATSVFIDRKSSISLI